jgi:hypothetical protein
MNGNEAIYESDLESKSSVNLRLTYVKEATRGQVELLQNILISPQKGIQTLPGAGTPFYGVTCAWKSGSWDSTLDHGFSTSLAVSSSIWLC